MATMQEISERIQVACQAGPAAALDAVDSMIGPEGFEMVHVPPSPRDGMVSKERNREESKVLTEVLPTKIADYRWEDAHTEVIGNDVVAMSFFIAGTLPDGSELRVPMKMYWTIRDGRVVKLESHADNVTMGAVLGSL